MRGARGDSTCLPFRGTVPQRRVNSGDNLQRFGHPARAIFATGPCRPHSGRRSGCRRVAGWQGSACVAGCCHIRTFIAGAISTRLSVAREAACWPDRPPAAPPSLPSGLPSAGATTIRSAGATEFDMAHLGLGRQIEEVGEHLHPARAETLSGVTKLRAPGGQHRGHPRAAFLQPADQVQRLVGRDAAAVTSRICRSVSMASPSAARLGQRARGTATSGQFGGLDDGEEGAARPHTEPIAHRLARSTRR